MSTEVGNLQASLNLDIRSFAKGISEAVSLARSLGSTLREALGNSSQGFSSLLRETAAVRSEVERLRSEAKALKAELNQAATPEAFTQMQQHTSRLRENIIYAANGVDILSSSASKAETAMSGVGGEAQETYMLLNSATGEVSELSDALKRAMGSAEGTSAAADETADDLQRAATAAKQTATNTKQVGTAAKTSSRETRSVGQNLSQASTFAKDLKRIISGIVISQAFYAMLNVMNELVRGSIKFANNMDQAQIAFKYLLGDASSASAMIENLQDFAIASPLDTSAVMDSTRKLMAMGFTAKSVIPTLKVLADTAAVFTGDAGEMSDMLSHVTLALGQMRASGKVMTQELRQLYNAGIPVFQILQEELGLTADQVRNIGKQSIDSGTAVTALLKGLQKRYAGAAKEFTSTIPGALAVIKDSFSVLYTELDKTPQGAFKEWINGIANSFEALVMITRAYGPGGFMQAIFPPKLHESIRNIVGALGQLGQALAIAGQILHDIFGQALDYIVRMLGWVLPPIMTFINGLMQLIRWVYTSVPFVRQLASAFAALLIVYVAVRAIQGLWVLLKLGKIVAWFTGGLQTLVKTIYSWVKSLIVAAAANWKVTLAVLALVAVLALIVANSDRAKAAMTRFFDAFKKMGVGFNPDDILQPEFDPGPAQNFDGSLSDIITDVDNLGDSSDKTAKKMKKMFNQSFDEVFLIDDSQDDALSSLEDTDMSGILGDMDSLLGKVDDLAMSGDFWKDWGNISDFLNLDTGDFFGDIKGTADEFWKAVVEAFSAPEWVGAGIGAALGGVIGFMFGGPMGAKIGALVGAAAGWLAGLYWDEVVKFFESVGLNKTTALSTAIAVPLGAAIGLKVGGPIGALVGAAIGFLVSWIIGEISDGLKTGDWTGIGTPIGIGLGAGIGFLVGGPLGALIGGAIGALVGWIVDMFIDGFTNGNWNEQALGGAIGGGIGAGIGMIVAGPVGAAIGAAIGALVGWLIGLIVENWDSISQWFKDFGANWIKGVGIIGDWFAGIGKSIGDFFKGIGKWFSDAWSNLTKWFSDVIGAIGGFFSDLGTWFANIGTAIGNFFGNLFSNIGEFFGNIFNKVGEFLSTLWNKITTGLAEFFAPIKEALDNLFNVISGILGDIWNGIVTVFTDIKNAVVTVLMEVWSVISEIFSFIFDLFVKIGTDIWNAVSGFFTKIWEGLSAFFIEIWTAVSGFFVDIWTDFTTWLSDIWNKITTWFGEIWTSITTWLGGIWTSIATWFTDVWTGFTTWLGEIWTKFTTWLGEIWTKITTWFGELFSKIGEFFGNIFSKIGEFFGNIFSKIVEFFTNIWNKVAGFFKDVWDKVTGFFKDILTGIRDFVADAINAFANFLSDLWSNIKSGVANIYQTFKDWIKNIWDNVFGKFFGWIKDGIAKLREFFGLSNKAKKTKVSGFNAETENAGASSLSYSTPMSDLPVDGHRDGGIFNKEHVAWFAEDDKPEAIIPLQNQNAMQPFVDSVSTGVIQALAPFLAGKGNNDQLPPIYVGTLVADDRGLKELERKLRIIRVKEERRGS